jgi:hypothetical protein
MAVLSDNSRRLPGTTQRVALPAASEPTLFVFRTSPMDVVDAG